MEESESPGARLRALVTKKHRAFVTELWLLFQGTVHVLEEEVRVLREERRLKNTQEPGAESKALQTEERQCENLPPDAESRPEPGPSSRKTSVKCVGVQTEEPQCSYGQRKRPEYRCAKTKAPQCEGLETEEPQCGDDLPQAEEAPQCEGVEDGQGGGSLNTEEHQCGDDLPNKEEGPDCQGLEAEAEERPECEGLESDELTVLYDLRDAEERLEFGGLEAVAEKEPAITGLQTDGLDSGHVFPDNEGLSDFERVDTDEPTDGHVLPDNEEAAEYKDLETEAEERAASVGAERGGVCAESGGVSADMSPNESLRRWIIERMMVMKPRVVLRRCDAKAPAEDLNSENLTENSSDSEDEQICQQRKRLRKKFVKTSTATRPDQDRDPDLDSEEMIQNENLMLEVTVFTDSGDEEGEGHDQSFLSETFEDTVTTAETGRGLCDETVGNIIDTKRDLREKYSCFLCPKSFYTKSGLKIHKQTHSTERPFECKECGTTFKHKTNLYRHKKIHLRMMSLSDGRLVHVCMLCREKFDSKNLLNKHISSHKLNGELQCPRCTKKFQCYSHLTRHSTCSAQGGFQKNPETRLSKPKPTNLKSYHKSRGAFRCSVCGNHYTQKGSLTRHQFLHRSDKKKDSKRQPSKKASAKRLRCPVCKKEYSLMSSFHKHVLLHPTTKCLICGRRFNSNYSVRRHMLTHTGEKPFGCPVCYLRFSQKSNLANHVVTVHQR